jgi:hypothetical protein
VVALRQAFASTLADPALLAEVERLGLYLEPKTGEEVSQLVGELLSLEPELVETVRRALQPPS